MRYKIHTGFSVDPGISSGEGGVSDAAVYVSVLVFPAFFYLFFGRRLSNNMQVLILVLRFFL